MVYSQVVSKAVLFLPQPKDSVDEAVVEEKDGVEACRVVFSHVAVGFSLQFVNVEASFEEVKAVTGVASHCQVHGIGNLYIAGSSVFPTGGLGTPTLTLLALTLRLADRLQEVVA